MQILSLLERRCACEKRNFIRHWYNLLQSSQSPKSGLSRDAQWHSSFLKEKWNARIVLWEFRLWIGCGILQRIVHKEANLVVQRILFWSGLEIWFTRADKTILEHPWFETEQRQRNRRVFNRSSCIWLSTSELKIPRLFFSQGSLHFACRVFVKIYAQRNSMKSRLINVQERRVIISLFFGMK